MKKLFLCSLLAMFCAATVNLIAQENTVTKKVQIKTEGDNSIKTIIIGAENSADFLNSKEDATKNIWISDDNEVITIDAEDFKFVADKESGNGPGDKVLSVNVNKEVVDGEVKRKVSIVIEENGEQEEIEWIDNGEIPAEIKTMLDEKGIDLTVLNGEDEKTITITIDDTDGNEKAIHTKKEIKKAYKIKTIDEEGNEKIMEWDGEGEMPAEMKKLMEEHVPHDNHKGHHKRHGKKRKMMIKKGMNKEDMFMHGHGEKTKRKHNKKGNGNKAQLGVHISNEGDGILVESVISESGAEEAGVKAGDVINSLDGTKVKIMEDLISGLSDKKPGEVVRLKVERDGKIQDIDVVLKGAMDTEIEYEIELDIDEGEWEEMKKDHKEKLSVCKDMKISVDEDIQKLFESIDIDMDEEGEIRIFLDQKGLEEINAENDRKEYKTVQLKEENIENPYNKTES